MLMGRCASQPLGHGFDEGRSKLRRGMGGEGGAREGNGASRSSAAEAASRLRKDEKRGAAAAAVSQAARMAGDSAGPSAARPTPSRLGSSWARPGEGGQREGEGERELANLACLAGGPGRGGVGSLDGCGGWGADGGRLRGAEGGLSVTNLVRLAGALGGGWLEMLGSWVGVG